jgi:biopolymer transport protein ExbD
MKSFLPEETEASIDISPLIDCVFILLIFFMVTSNFVRDMAVEIERPKASTAVAVPSKSVRVYIDAAGGTYIDEKAVRPWMLQTHVRELLQTLSTRTVLVVTDRRVPAERLIEVVDQCRLGGASEVAVATSGAPEAGGP